MLLDVVMGTEDSGLRLARRIREELDNQVVPILLRTGQTGQAPEQKIIVDFDINDYKPKTELTAQKLFTGISAEWQAAGKFPDETTSTFMSLVGLDST